VEQDDGRFGNADRATAAAQSNPQAVSSKAGIPSAAIVLIAKGDPEQKPMLYACQKCGRVHSPQIYLASEEVRHKTAREAAENCYECISHYNCSSCGSETPKGLTKCKTCRLAEKLNKATEIPDNGGPYCNFDSDTYYFDIEEARDDGLEWVAPCEATYPHVNAYDVLERLTEEMFEDASLDDLNGVEEFLDAVAAFNKAQNTPTFWGNEKFKINVASAIEARSDTTGTGAAEGESATPKDDAQ